MGSWTHDGFLDSRRVLGFTLGSGKKGRLYAPRLIASDGSEFHKTFYGIVLTVIINECTAQLFITHAASHVTLCQTKHMFTHLPKQHEYVLETFPMHAGYHIFDRQNYINELGLRPCVSCEIKSYRWS